MLTAFMLKSRSNICTSDFSDHMTITGMEKSCFEIQSNSVLHVDGKEIIYEHFGVVATFSKLDIDYHFISGDNRVKGTPAPVLGGRDVLDFDY